MEASSQQAITVGVEESPQDGGETHGDPLKNLETEMQSIFDSLEAVEIPLPPPDSPQRLSPHPQKGDDAKPPVQDSTVADPSPKTVLEKTSSVEPSIHKSKACQDRDI